VATTSDGNVENLQDLFGVKAFGDRAALAVGLAIAFALGALIGIQRGWQYRERPSGQRVAGVRTHALVGLFGGLSVALSQQLGPWTFNLALASVAILAVAGYRAQAADYHDYSITGAVGLLLTFVFGALAVMGQIAIAATAAVITALVLDNKDEIHGALLKLRDNELDAGLKLLLISVVVLPLLPNQGFGPGNVINPYEVWWMVVLIASISFVGYFAMRWGGTEKGILFTSLFAGLSSSTALTLHFSRLARDDGDLRRLLGAGLLLGCAVMFPRVLVYCALINRALLAELVAPLLMMMLALLVPALLIWWRQHHIAAVKPFTGRQNPLDLKSAFGFALLLVLILVATEVMKNWMGDRGIYLLAAISGAADVDAITLSLTRLSQQGLNAHTAVIGIVLAAAVNNLVKTAMAGGIGGLGFLAWIIGPMLLSSASGLLIAWW